MTFKLLSNGTVGSWQASNGTAILFPEMKVEIGGEKKLRGGAPVCCPNFGPAPTDGPYEGIQLPNHGLVRTCNMIDGKPVNGNRAVYQSGPTEHDDGWTGTHHMFQYPCFHQVWTSAKLGKSKLGDEQMHHRIRLGTEPIHDVDMPYSIGFHPYFATAGGKFLLRHGDQNWRSSDLSVNEPLFVPNKGPFFDIVTKSTKVQIELLRGYEGFYIWTDRPDLYICVEPVTFRSGPSYEMLYSGDSASCECLMTYSPRN